MIVPGLRSFADVDAPIVQLDRFSQVTGDRNGGYPTDEKVARLLSSAGGLCWLYMRDDTTSDPSFYLADDVLIAADKAVDLTNAAARDFGASIRNLRDNSATSREESIVTIRADRIRGAYEDDDFTLFSFAKHERLFDVVRWTGDGADGQRLDHGLDRAPGMIMVKRTDTTGDWAVYHNEATAAPEEVYLVFGSEAAAVDSANYWTNTPPTDESFTVGSNLNASTAEYVAFIFADDPRGDGCIKTGSYTGTGSGGVPLQHCGWMPQWIFVKSTTAAEDWRLYCQSRSVSPGSSTWDFGFLISDDVTAPAPFITTTRLLVNDLGWQTYGTFGDEGMNTSGEDYVWMAVRAASGGLVYP